ncbi:MAG: RNA-guided endonuclease TnpB family protein, partial [Candidatus Sericytochromatia bacterium]
MDQVLTVNCRIIIPFWLRPSIDATVSAFVDACNFVREIAQESGVRNKLTLQHLAYQAIRTRFKLPANLAIRAIARVAQSMKAGHRNTRFRSLSVDLDRRVFRLRERDWT